MATSAQPVINKAPAEVSEFWLTCAAFSGAIKFTDKTTIVDLVKVQQQIHDSIVLLAKSSEKLPNTYMQTVFQLQTPPEKCCLYANVALPASLGTDIRVALFKIVLSDRPVADLKKKFEDGKAEKKKFTGALELDLKVEQQGYSMLCAMFDLIKKFWLHNTKHMDIASKPSTTTWVPSPGEVSTKLVTAINATFKTVWGEDPDNPGQPLKDNWWMQKMEELITSKIKHPKTETTIVFKTEGFFAPVEFDATAATTDVDYGSKDALTTIPADVLLGGARPRKRGKLYKFPYHAAFKKADQKLYHFGSVSAGMLIGDLTAAAKKAGAASATGANRGIESPSPISLRYLIDVLYPDVDDGEPTRMMMDALAKGGITNTNQLFSLDRDAWVAKGLPIGIYNRSHCDLDQIYTQQE